MSFAVANDQVWKRIADEKQASAKTMARVAVGAVVVSAVFAGTTFSAHSKHSSMCSFVGERHVSESSTYEESVFTEQLLKDFCT